MADRQLLQLGKQHGVEPQLAPKQRSMTAFFSKAEPSAHNNAVAAEMAAGREQALVKRAAEAAVAEEAAKRPKGTRVRALSAKSKSKSKCIERMQQ